MSSMEALGMAMAMFCAMVPGNNTVRWSTVAILARSHSMLILMTINASTLEGSKRVERHPINKHMTRLRLIQALDQ